MQIKFVYEKKQVIHALRLHFIGRHEVKLLVILVNVFAIIAAILFFFQKVSPLAFLLSSILWLSLMIALWYILPGSVYSKTSTFKDAFTLSMNNNGIVLENPKGEVFWEWNKIKKFIESVNFFHLYFDSKSFFLIPKYSTEEEMRIEEVRQLLKTNIKNYKD